MSGKQDEKPYKSVAGNRFSLRSSFLDQVKQVKFIQMIFKSDLLYITWRGIISAVIVFFGVGFFFVIRSLSGVDGATKIKNILPILLIIIGFLLISLNIVYTNPSMGNQFVVSVKFLKNKIKHIRKPNEIAFLRNFRFAKQDVDKSVVEKKVKTSIGYKTVYICAFQVRGYISQVSFDAELRHLASLQDNLLESLERDTICTVTNTIQKSTVKPKDLPINATIGMKKKRDKNYMVAESIPRNQQLKTTVYLSSPTYETLIVRRNDVMNVFNRGLVIDYLPLKGNELKKRIKSIYTDVD